MTRITAMTLVLAAAVSAAFAEPFDTKGWSWKRPLETGGTAGFTQVIVPPEVFDASQPTLSDLRVLNGRGELAQSAVFFGRTADVVRVEWKPAQLLNRAFEPAKFERATLDFGQPVLKNRTRLNLSGDNFRRRALVEASTDTLAWESIAENLFLFDISLPGKQFKVDTLDFPDNNFRYLRVTVFNMPDDPRRVEIISAEAAQERKIAAGELLPVEAVLTASRVDDKLKASIFEWDLRWRNLPVALASFDIADAFFDRAFELYGRNSTTETVTVRIEGGTEKREQEAPWASVGSGVLYRILEQDKTLESLNADWISAPYRHIQLRVMNGDNPPLRVKGAKFQRRSASVVFYARQGESYALVGGNPVAGTPNFDITRAVRNLDERTLAQVALGPPVELAAAADLAPWSERNSLLIYAALGVAVAAMLLLIVRGMRSAGTPKPE
jgi:hypothetical protein